MYNADTSTPSLPFSNLVTVERRCFGAKKGKDISEFLKASIYGIDGYVEEAKKIEYKEILHCKEITTGKRGIISGAPGCGKTTLSRKLCQDLYSQALPNKYKMILLVELRKLKPSLKEMKEDIDLQFLLRGAGVSNLPQLCETMEKSDGEGVAMILDGFDEVADYLGKSPFLRNLLSMEEPYLCECDAFVTTRPSHCPDLMSMIRRPSCHVEILGFTDFEIDTYVQNFFREASSDKSEAEQKYKIVIDKLNNIPVIRGMSRIPLVLKVICKVQDHLGSAPLPETVSGIFSLYICHQLVEYLVWASQCTGAPINDVLKIPTDLFPGFYPLCEIAYKCCSDKTGQRLILTEEDVKEVKEHIDKRGSIYNLLFSERVDETSPVAGFVYQFNHKTVQETLAAIHIADQTEGDQQRIWIENFARPEMGGVWKVYCGLTSLRFVDLTTLSQSSLSQRARDAGVSTRDDDKLVMVSLFEGGNRYLSARILPTLIGRSLSFSLNSPYDALVLQSTLRDHPSLEELVLWGSGSHPIGVESLTSSISQHQSLRKLSLSSLHQSGALCVVVITMYYSLHVLYSFFFTSPVHAYMLASKGVMYKAGATSRASATVHDHNTFCHCKYIYVVILMPTLANDSVLTCEVPQSCHVDIVYSPDCGRHAYVHKIINFS